MHQETLLALALFFFTALHSQCSQAQRGNVSEL
jgi:hypothetical protein